MDFVPKQEKVHVQKFKLVGIQKRVQIANEKDPENNIFRQTYHEYYAKRIGDQIANRVHPKRTYSVYYDIKDQNDPEKENYNFLVGEEVSEIGESELTALEIQEQDYIKFTAGPGPIPDIIKQTWNYVHKLTPEQLGGKRTYRTEFEIYREGQTDLQNMIVELYIGIE